MSGMEKARREAAAAEAAIKAGRDLAAQVRSSSPDYLRCKAAAARNAPVEMNLIEEALSFEAALWHGVDLGELTDFFNTAGGLTEHDRDAAKQDRARAVAAYAEGDVDRAMGIIGHLVTARSAYERMGPPANAELRREKQTQEWRAKGAASRRKYTDKDIDRWREIRITAYPHLKKLAAAKKIAELEHPYSEGADRTTREEVKAVRKRTAEKIRKLL